MGHKVSPKAFRIPYIKDWTARWYANSKDYAKEVNVDNTIREFLAVEFKDIPMGDIIIARDQDSVIITVYTAKSSLVIGKDGENIDRITSLLTRKLDRVVKVSVKEIKNPDIDANVVRFMIANQIEQRLPYKRAIKQAISKSMEKGAKGIKVKIGGRLNGTDMARAETFKEGNTPNQTIRANIDYATSRAETTYGTLGLKVWIYTGDIFK